MTEEQKFECQVQDNIHKLSQSATLPTATMGWMLDAGLTGAYSYNFRWLGRPIIQYPQDIVAFQEIVWQVKPDLIIETGIAHGGSLIMSASMLVLLDYIDAVGSGQGIERSQRKVLGIDIDIRPHNRQAIEAHPLAHKISMIQGSSIDRQVVDQVIEIARQHTNILVVLDSNHTHDHVLAELRAYAPLVTPGSYCIVYDTLVEDMPDNLFSDRPWGPGNSPKTAVWHYLKENDDFEIDASIQQKLLITVAPDGFLKRRI